MEEKILSLLSKYTGHEVIHLASRGNKAILKALRIAKLLNPDYDFLTVDEGGWITYPQYSKKLKKGPDYLKTDYGVIDLSELEKAFLRKKYSALIYSNPAGYYANQPVKEIYEICRRNDCFVIMDVTGSIGSELCDGRYADFMLGSFGNAKPVNFGRGGFLSIKDKEIIKDLSIDFSDLNADDFDFSGLYEKLSSVQKRYDFFYGVCSKIKKDLNKYSVLHPEKKGINVIVGFSNLIEKGDIEKYCIDNGYEYTLCPRYIRVKEDAISIEVKRLV